MADSQRKTANLFDKDNADTQNLYVYTDDALVHEDPNTVSVVFPCQSSTTYTISKTISSRFAVGYTEVYPQNGTRAYRVNADNTATTLSITTGSNAGYIVIFIAYTPQETKTTQEILNSIMINEGQTALPYEPYGWVHSLRKLGTATETIQSGNTIYANGQPITTYTLKGNEEHTGTPSPQNPVMPQGVGNKTANLFDGQLQQGYYSYLTGEHNLANAYVCTHLIPCTDNTTYTFRCINTGGGSKNYGYCFFDSTQNRIGEDHIDGLTEGNVVIHTATTPQNTAFLAINIAYGRYQTSIIRPSDITNFMLNEGSTALDYEPYGYKIPISSGGVTTNIYLGSTQTVRAIKKLVLDGTENWGENPCNIGYRFNIPITSAMQSDKTFGVRSLCTHQILVNFGETYNVLGAYTITSTSELCMTLNRDTRLASWKSWLAAQYANGTPVTIWYVLVTSQTATVNEPLMKIGDYADTLSNATAIPTTEGANSITVDTTVQPSEFTATWTGWHDASVKEWDGSDWQ